MPLRSRSISRLGEWSPLICDGIVTVHITPVSGLASSAGGNARLVIESTPTREYLIVYTGRTT